MSYRTQKGFTLIEVIVAIAVVAILAGIITPSVVKHLDDAKRARAANDCQVIGAALANFYKDTGHWPNWTSAGAPGLTLLVGEGSTPASSGAGSAPWVTTAIDYTQGDFLRNHLVADRPGNQAAAALIYPRAVGEFSWRGPYMQAIPADPWGNRYMVNIGNIAPANANAVWVISSGPDGIMQTAINTAIPAAGTVFNPLGDDVAYRLK
jgi:prepilin-type N-terminal cleavage/methylation domain-containing protein